MTSVGSLSRSEEDAVVIFWRSVALVEKDLRGMYLWDSVATEANVWALVGIVTLVARRLLVLTSQCSSSLIYLQCRRVRSSFFLGVWEVNNLFLFRSKVFIQFGISLLSLMRSLILASVSRNVSMISIN